MNSIINYFKKIARKLRISITKFFSNFRYSKYPMFIQYGFEHYKFKDTFVILDVLQPGDIILKTHDNYLSGLFIPGDWKHAGIVINSKEVIEATREGVHINDIIEFSRTDHLCILRLKNITESITKTVVSRALERYKFKYDYDFEPENNKLYCSELVLESFKDYLNITIEPRKILNLYTIWPIVTPTDIFNSNQLEVIFNSNESNKY